jgi:pyrroloquinoline-quinone synthase
MKMLVEEIMMKYPYHHNPYFTDLGSGEMSKSRFINTQYQFYHAVTHFTRLLALISASIPTYEERVNIIKNLWEEHGEGNMDMTHGSTFTTFMKRLTKEPSVSFPSAGPAVSKFNQSLEEICLKENYLVGTAALGMIERMFADISLFIGQMTVKHKWLSNIEMIHYNLHQDLDHIHAADFFNILQPHLPEKEKSALIRQGLEKGAVIFLNLYTDLHKESG